jgi:hypothetical protein
MARLLLEFTAPLFRYHAGPERDLILSDYDMADCDGTPEHGSFRAWRAGRTDIDHRMRGPTLWRGRNWNRTLRVHDGTIPSISFRGSNFRSSKQKSRPGETQGRLRTRAAGLTTSLSDMFAPRQHS